MLKFVTLDDIKTARNWFLCHNVVLDGRLLEPRMQLNDVMLKYIISRTNSTNMKQYIIVADKSQEDYDCEIREFIIKTLKKMIQEEIKFVNERYNYIIVEEFSSRIELLMVEAFRNMELNYIIKLITNPVILVKSIKLGILSFYFGVKMHVKYKEVNDLIYASLLMHLNLCNDTVFNDITDEHFITDYKHKIVVSSYDIIKDDGKITTNVKRIIKYANVNTQNNLGIAYHINEKGEKEEILRDVTLELIILANDILTYNFNNRAVKKLYDEQRPNSLLRPAIDNFMNDYNEKTIHNAKALITLKNFFKNIFFA